MNKDFDTLWETGINDRCPLSDQQLAEMIAHAKEQPSQTGTMTYREQHPFRPWLAPLAVAAGLTLLIIPTTMKNAHAAVPQSVVYQGQQVKFICNNRCDANSVVESLDAYLLKS